MNDIDRRAIAGRIRGLLAGQDFGDYGRTARRLGISEIALRMTIDETEPHPTLEVLMAMVTRYGVDPGWLVTGEYESAAHRHALSQDESETRLTLNRLLNDRQAPRDRRSGEIPDEGRQH